MDRDKRERELQRFLASIADALVDIIRDYTENIGFAIILFDKQRCQGMHYVSDTEVDNVIDLMRRLADVLEKDSNNAEPS